MYVCACTSHTHTHTDTPPAFTKMRCCFEVRRSVQTHKPHSTPAHTTIPEEVETWNTL